MNTHMRVSCVCLITSKAYQWFVA